MTRVEADPPSENDDWECSQCGSGDPHHAYYLNDGEIEVDVTCDGVYIIDRVDHEGFFLSPEQFKELIIHFAGSGHTTVGE